MGLKYLLDTNILSELARPHPNPQVVEKMRIHSGEYGTAVTAWHEMQYGVQRMPASQRRNHYQSYLDTLEQAGLPILPYEKAAGEWLAQERGWLSKQGITTALADGEIAAVAMTNHLILVTRNLADFTHFNDLTLENWFAE